MMDEAFALTTRRVVHLYYGDEIAMTGGNDPDNRRDFPGGWPGDPIDAFTPAGRTGDAATVFNFTRELLHFRQTHPALQREISPSLDQSGSIRVPAHYPGRARSRRSEPCRQREDDFGRMDDLNGGWHAPKIVRGRFAGFRCGRREGYD